MAVVAEDAWIWRSKLSSFLFWWWWMRMRMKCRTYVMYVCAFRIGVTTIVLGLKEVIDWQWLRYGVE